MGKRSQRRQRHAWQLTRSLPTYAQPVEICAECGKRGYSSREQAKDTGRQLHPGARLRIYKCGPLWHLTSQGASATEYYRSQRAVQQTDSEAS